MLVALTDVITLATGRDDPCNSAFWYFSFGIFAVAVSLASYMILLKMVSNIFLSVIKQIDETIAVVDLDCGTTLLSRLGLFAR